jgi:hypothetical protein
MIGKIPALAAHFTLPLFGEPVKLAANTREKPPPC